MQEASSTSAQYAAKTILVVEDDEEIATFLLQVLSQETPYRILLFQSGYEALKATREVVPNLFLLDYYLPGMTGLLLYDQFQTIKRLETVPAIMMSADLPPIEELKKRHITALHKPFDLDDLLATVEQFLA